MHFSTYLKELRFAVLSRLNWRTRAALLNATARFHLHNYAQRAKSRQSAIELDLLIANGRTSLFVIRADARVTLRGLAQGLDYGSATEIRG